MPINGNVLKTPPQRVAAWFVPAFLAYGLLCATAANAQVLSSPIRTAPPATGKAAAASAPATPGDLALDFPLGGRQGPGVHGANSPFPPLVGRADVLAWSQLTSVKTQKVDSRFLPAFNAEQMALHQKTQRIQGYMMPPNPGEKQTHFLLSSVPLTCSFCTPGGPESMVEVRSKTPVRYSLEPVVMEGVFSVLPDDPYGLYYRMTDAKSVR